MESFKTIHARAAKRHGGEKALEALLTKPKSTAALKKIPDDRWLAAMTKSVFQAGFSWKVVEAKWPGFEEAFDHFDPHRVAFYSGEDMGRLVSDARIVRNGAKIKATVENARFVVELAREHGSAAAFFAASKPENYTDLLDVLKKRSSRLSGAAAQYFLRFQGVDSFMLSPSVTAALIKANVVDGPPTSRKAMAAVQAAFNQWQKESGRSLTEISRILARSIDP
ncbi:MAG: DNA-3-methyladenine glycosylase I [Parvibaculum sp.]|uniref:DNA-3-methyladenine glycosylase I n=1 Tax=Parvibaculum sp. TaxID=2024848 RepID=UPI003C778BF9